MPCTDIKIIGLSGKMGSGKDYMAEQVLKPYFLKKNMICKTMSFADHLKVSTAAENGLDITEMYGDKTPKVRMMLQKRGTEEGRDKFGPNIWIKTLEAWIKLTELRHEADVILICDCRFKNEADWMSNNGVLIRLNAPDRNKERALKEAGGNKELFDIISNHQSETDLDDYNFKYKIDNSKSNCIDACKKIQSILESE